jgi:hypothetical protein
MRQILSIQLMFLSFFLSFLLFRQLVHAQVANEGLADLPSQRWLPLPTGDQTEFTAQARILMQLRDRVAPPTAPTPSPSVQPELSPDQLKKIDEAMQMWRDIAGDQPLPDLNDIPQEWLGALSDQETRHQAQQILEQYAKQRNLPRGNDRAQNSSRVQIPNSSSKAGALPQPSPSANAPRPSESTEPVTQRGNNGPSNGSSNLTSKQPSTPENPLSPERLESLKKLFEQVSASAKSNQSNSSVRPNPQLAPARRTPAETVPRSDTEPRADPKMQRDNEPSDGRRPSGESGQLNRLRAPEDAGPARPREQVSPRQSEFISNDDLFGPAFKEATKLAEPTGKTDESNAPLKDALNDPVSNAGTTDIETPSDPDFEKLFDANDTSPSLRPESRTREPGASVQDFPVSPTQTSSDALPSNKLEQGAGAPRSSTTANIREQVDRWGLGATLRGIVERTLKEHGADEDPSSIIKSLQEIANKKGTSESRTSATPPANSAFQPPPNPLRVSKAVTARNPKGSASASPPSDRSTGAKPSELSGISASDFWNAISSPPAHRASDRTNRSEANNSAWLNDWSFRVGMREWTILGLGLVLCAILIYLARTSLNALEPTVIDSREVARMLENGIHSRADVVSVFHRCVLGRPYSAAPWWTHNFVVQRAQEATPHAADAIRELAGIYEQARYLPKHVELSSAQLQQARAAFEQLTTPST